MTKETVRRVAHDLRVRTAQEKIRKRRSSTKSYILHYFYEESPEVTIAVLRKILNVHKNDIKKVAKYFGVSSQTIRNYLKTVDNNGPDVQKRETKKDRISHLENMIRELRKDLGYKDEI